jgi:3-hydroxyacyl-[acyl-carrier-protein] dehydratase
MDLSLPLDYSAIERILPHRYPFLLVDRITEFDPDKRIVGIKNVTLNERYLSHQPGEQPVLLTILTEAVAQVGAIMILAKPENRKTDLLHGNRARAVSQARSPGDQVVIEAVVRRLRSRWACSAAWRASTAGCRRGHDDVRSRPSRRKIAQPVNAQP